MDPNKTNWLDEVKADAKRITLKRIREQEELRAEREAKEQRKLEKVLAKKADTKSTPKKKG